MMEHDSMTTLPSWKGYTKQGQVGHQAAHGLNAATLLTLTYIKAMDRFLQVERGPA